MDWNLQNLIVLVLYLALLVYLGIWSERGSRRSATGFLLADRSATLPWIIMSVFATGVGSLAYIGTVGMIAKGGVIDLWFEFFCCAGIAIMALLFVRKLRTSGIISFWDSIAFRYGPRTMLGYALFVIIGIPFGLASMTKGGGLAFSDMFPVLREARLIDPVVLGALLLLAIIGVYLFLGGFKACLVTDMMQGILTWAAMIVPTVAIFFILGEGSFLRGWDRILEYYRAHHLENYLRFDRVVGPTAPAKEYTYSFITAMFILQVLLFMLPGQFYGSRYMAAKTERIARQGPILALILTTVPYGLFINVTGLAFKAYAPEVSGDELFTGTLRKLAATHAVPTVVSSLLLVALLAAVMGTLDSAIMSNMSNITMGIYKQFIRPRADGRQIVRASRVVLAILVLTAVVGAFAMPESIWFLQIAIGSIVGPISFVLIVGAFLVRRSTRQGALAGGIAGSFLALLFTALLTGFRGQYTWMIWPWLEAHWPDWLHSQFFTYPIGLAVFFIVSRRSPPERPEHLERLFTAEQTMRYAETYGFTEPYVILPEDSVEGARRFGLTVMRFGRARRAHGPEDALHRFAESEGLRVWPAYARFRSWEEVLDERLKGLYAQGLDVARGFDAEGTGGGERLAAKLVGGAVVLASMALYFLMFWLFPLRFWASMACYACGSVFLFGGFSIFFGDYRWCRRLIDRIAPRGAAPR